MILLKDDNTISWEPYPDSTDISEQNHKFQELIGCSVYLKVRPDGLYASPFNCRIMPDPKKDGAAVIMLVDESGLIKKRPTNPIASKLYGIEFHGQRIAGDVLFVGLKETIWGETEFCELDMKVEDKLYKELLKEVEKIGL